MALLSADAVDGFLANPDRIERLMEEMAVGRQLAAKIHQSLLPSPVRHPQIDVDVRYLSIDTVSGNYCQVRFPIPTTCYITMCDVQGHGIVPSLLATRVSSEVRHYISDRLRPMAIVRSLNKFIYDHFHDFDVSLSFIAAQIELEHRTITYSGAGHPSVLLLRRSGSPVCRLESQNALIGVSECCLSDEPEHTRAMAEGDRLLFYTSGLIKAPDVDGHQQDPTLLEEIAVDARSADTFDMADQILEQLAQFHDDPPNVDKTLIVAEIK